jgi:UDP-N-acetylglucosamine 2-epimerase
MSKLLKVMTVVGTRPEIIRLSRVIHALDQASAIEHIFVHTGQNYDYELNEIFFKDMQIRKPDHFLSAAGANPSETIGNIFIAIDKLLEKIKPDAFLVLGDTNSCLCAIPAKKRHIPIFHMEAGNRCFDQRVPEETNRKIVDHISDINLTYSDIAREYLLREGLPSDRIIKTGSPMFEVLNHYSRKINASKITSKLKLKRHSYFIVSCHREENVSNKKQFSVFLKTLAELSKKYNYPVIVSTHPRTKKVIEGLNINLGSSIRFLKPLGFSDYVNLQKNAFVVLSDSGTISEEASILDFPALNIREAHERPEAMEETSVIMTGFDPDSIFQGVQQLSALKRGKRQFRQVADYTMPNVSEKVVRIILSYHKYIKRVVWGE